jgi:hypothetical protein
LGEYASLALDSHGYPHIAYHDYYYFDYRYARPNHNLKYARWDGDSWQIETVDSEGRQRMYVTLALDSHGYPHIAYTDGTLRYAHWNGYSWWFETVDPGGGKGLWSISLALDSTDCPHIAYFIRHDWEDGDLRYAYLEGAPGPVTADVVDEGVLVGWAVTGDAPASLRVLRSAGEGEPVYVSGALPGEAVRWLDMEVDVGVGYRYWLETTDGDGTVSRFGPSDAVLFPVAVRELALSIYPSPASGSFTVDCTLPDDGRVSIALYDLSGRRVSTVFDGETAAGRHEYSYNAAALPPGVYLVRLATDAGTLTRRVVVAR